jgi:hypothetical protein
MAVVVASMAVIVLTALAVLLAVFGMHLITRSPRVRQRIRLGALAVGTTAYSVRREIAHRVRLVGRYARRHLAQSASRAWRSVEPVMERTGSELAERVTEQARLFIDRVKTGIEYVRPIAPHSGRPAKSGSARVPATAMFTQPASDRPGTRGRGDGPSTERTAR